MLNLSLDSSDIDDFAPFINLIEYKKVVNETLFDNEDKIIEKAKTLYTKYPKVLCHNDVLLANFIKSSSNSYLIDYEYAGKNIALFDIVSFLFENNIEGEEKQKQFIKQYFNN
jgi:thiamine kinase-like enzyme